ncbi:pyridoxamine 5'-phosphate oxidase family protein [Kitasatospora purpeofusca]|uniref:pyridoxamine 5'-phosphate oxidase family protein n=1 Tax=Kitasatospora purpeofusca TaxID=67352 RepID=UPI0022560D2C|nr:pyridoxamine 5'-phosphate oxidase family protein [Kitasatospora purpeofusca]MCX4690316.1 pyridoxamine 5'-phosphate oxidase family protein [Kitasatospora purpeofusca]MCX4755710.1 pyridoxamine 5'-phosphate oxidase family protein [Kitasatospora purpeofusca]WSR36428.1 pyridoxamine 5'-phosphate oxidase family protein [Kitasatospora purpeofusca]WSR44714.1 pyridoxamine 5'-phosphate oxidase family protein [Kitasatospora purpeofusca]
MTPHSTTLDEWECRRRLAGLTVGRVVYTVDALPAVQPARYSLGADGSVLLNAGAGSELVRAVSGAIVAFEAGELDATEGSGWSVTVLGRADVMPDRVAANGPTDTVTVRILPELVSGRLFASTRPDRL